MKGLKKATKTLAAATLLLTIALTVACSQKPPLDIEKLSKLPAPTYEQALDLAKKVSFTWWTAKPGAWDPLMVHLFMPEEKFYAATLEEYLDWEVLFYIAEKSGLHRSWIFSNEDSKCRWKYILNWTVPGRIARRLGVPGPYEWYSPPVSRALKYGRGIGAVLSKSLQAKFWREMNRLNRKFFDRVARFFIKYPEIYYLASDGFTRKFIGLDSLPDRYFFRDANGTEHFLGGFKGPIAIGGDYLPGMFSYALDDPAGGFIFESGHLADVGVRWYSMAGRKPYFSGSRIGFIKPPSLSSYIGFFWWWRLKPEYFKRKGKEVCPDQWMDCYEYLWQKYAKEKDKERQFMFETRMFYAAFKPGPDGPVPRSKEEASKIGRMLTSFGNPNFLFFDPTDMASIRKALIAFFKGTGTRIKARPPVDLLQICKLRHRPMDWLFCRNGRIETDPKALGLTHYYNDCFSNSKPVNEKCVRSAFAFDSPVEEVCSRLARGIRFFFKLRECRGRLTRGIFKREKHALGCRKVLGPLAWWSAAGWGREARIIFRIELEKAKREDRRIREEIRFKKELERIRGGGDLPVRIRSFWEDLTK